MSIETFSDYVKTYSEKYYLSIPEGVSIDQFVECLSRAHEGDLQHLLTDHKEIYDHWVKVNQERKFGYTDDEMDGKAAEKIGKFGTKLGLDTFPQDRDWYKPHLDEAVKVTGETSADGDS